MNCSKQASVFSRSTTTFKITGWSVRHTGYSLIESLATAGQIVYFIHYPQLNTSYVAFNKLNRQPNIICHLRSLHASLQVETVRSSPLEDLEHGLECPSTTAFFSSRSFISEIELHAYLHKFGSLRALSVSYSPKSQKWLCKATFYERYSLDRLIGQQASVALKLANGTFVRVQRVRVNGKAPTATNMHAYNASSPTSKLCGQANLVNRAFRDVSHSNQQIRDTVFNHNKLRKTVVSSSCSRERKAVLPSSTVFKSAELFIENVLRIVKCHKNESISSRKSSLLVNTRRAASLDGSRDRSGVKINVSTLPQDKKTVGNLEWLNDENELYFVQLNRASKSRAYNSHYASYISRGTTDHKGNASYLSTDDLSDGYSAEESPEIIEPLSVCTPNQARSGKDISLVPLTVYSSGSEFSDAKLDSANQYKINFDTYLGSFSGQLYHEDIPSEPKNGEYNYSKPTIDYFSFPCY